MPKKDGQVVLTYFVTKSKESRTFCSVSDTNSGFLVTGGVIRISYFPKKNPKTAHKIRNVGRTPSASPTYIPIF